MFGYYKRADPFLLSKEWKAKRAQILDDDKYECQYHKERGSYKHATMVHHVKHRDKFPELALEKYYIDENGIQQRNLMSLCNECHELQHPERKWKVKEPLTKERW